MVCVTVYSPWFKREILRKIKRSKISETGDATPTKIGLHEFYINPYLHMVQTEIWPFLKVALSPKLKRPCPPKIGVHACDINPYLHEFFEPIPIN